MLTINTRPSVEVLHNVHVMTSINPLSEEVQDNG